MIFLALKTEDGRITGKISFYCRMLGVSRQGFYKYLANKDCPWKYQDLADAMKEIASEDELLSGKLNDAPSGRLFRADFRTLQMCQSL